MRNLDEMTITQAVLAYNRGASDARLYEVMTSLVQHLHAFARDIKLTEGEWRQGMAFLGDVGQVAPASEEFALLSNVLGLSTLVLVQNERKPAVCTQATAFYTAPGPHAELRDLGADINPQLGGPKGYVQGVVRDEKGGPVPNAQLHLRVAGVEALLQADDQGRYHFSTSLPGSHQVRHDGPVKQLLAVLNRHAWRPAHLAFSVSAAGHQPLTTHVYREGDPYLDSDALFAVRPSLITQWQCQPAGATPDGGHSDEVFYTLTFDFVLAKQPLG
ncbi:hydroxyquinol 1,2-dioxygenase [Pseudomonas sp. BIGb0450]|jgi:hydroxyquinol 1,2-dioxygenase|uniref:dioxygenase family protein n=1 Tax=Pseudomonas TaxID=286 RepID=UPI000F81D726|nr:MULTISPECIES: dioxygenase [Pseudomonas]MBK3443062.1 6-chlorohydroxyquinol-1,2-dioxygenase [Pseudomonas lactis]MCS3419416.1 hydroxyquinol 1,2-dioxygenase [Pseudomonas sp. BIGb0558]MCS3438212.1 hydroxyquinol 1,2-dioxygenase [Pseudomonas sp. BIGb0450]NMX45359.1 6-chlorohydroxyquinol-1,2-dioxygenase [Pseudomonas sp. WS 5407]NWD24142.1 6-chlorohydroxyquinol-1,2-dioxygenase [Pseudomonas yamanorum]